MTQNILIPKKICLDLKDSNVLKLENRPKNLYNNMSFTQNKVQLNNL